MRVRIARAAANDLSEIADWIAQDSPAAALHMVSRLRDACRSLEQFPERAPVVGLRSLRRRPIDDYAIFYRVTTEVEIVRVLHSARDWASLLNES
jgi:toxin ParE1/3/4